ncbi:MAG: aldo/keto reductase, partial [Chloroflexota bacterium]|nr:aldo/keto reductase [Chloroflexota bacterium]
SPVSYDYEVAPPKLIKRAKDIEEITNKFNVSLKSASLNFVLMNSQVFSVVPGMSSINEVKDNIDITNENIPIELWSDLSENGFI